MSDQSVSSLCDYLRRVVYFEHLNPATIEYIAARLIPRRAVAGELLFVEGEPSAGLWLIQQGRVKFYKINPDGQEQILRLCGDGDTFNDIGAFDRGPNPANATALHDSRLFTLPTDFLCNLIQRDPAFAQRVIEVLSSRLRLFTHQIENLTLYSVVVRVARFLLQQIENPSLSGPGVTRMAMAAHLSTTPQTISTVLRELESMGAIEFDRHHIRIVRDDLLRTIALL